MKNKIMRLFLALSLIAGIGAVGIAKAASPYKLNIPFDFTVNGKLMKAGDYELKFGVSTSDSKTFLLRSADGKNAAFVSNFLPLADSKAKEAQLFFEKSENGYSLKKIDTARVRVNLTEENRGLGKVVRVEINPAK